FSRPLSLVARRISGIQFEGFFRSSNRRLRKRHHAAPALFEISKLKFDPTLFERQAKMRSVTLFQTLAQRKLLVTGSKDICEFLLVREYLRWRSISEKVLRLRQS